MTVRMVMLVKCCFVTRAQKILAGSVDWVVVVREESDLSPVLIVFLNCCTFLCQI